MCETFSIILRHETKRNILLVYTSRLQIKVLKKQTKSYLKNVIIVVVCSGFLDFVLILDSKNIILDYSTDLSLT